MTQFFFQKVLYAVFSLFIFLFVFPHFIIMLMGRFGFEINFFAAFLVSLAVLLAKRRLKKFKVNDY